MSTEQPLNPDAWEQIERVADYGGMHDGEYAGIRYVVEATAAEWSCIAVRRDVIEATPSIDVDSADADAHQFVQGLRGRGMSQADQVRYAESMLTLARQVVQTQTVLLRAPRQMRATWERALERHTDKSRSATSYEAPEER